MLKTNPPSAPEPQDKLWANMAAELVLAVLYILSLLDLVVVRGEGEVAGGGLP